jgi:hypothetical protein
MAIAFPAGFNESPQKVAVQESGLLGGLLDVVSGQIVN